MKNVLAVLICLTLIMFTAAIAEEADFGEYTIDIPASFTYDETYMEEDEMGFWYADNCELVVYQFEGLFTAEELESMIVEEVGEEAQQHGTTTINGINCVYAVEKYREDGEDTDSYAVMYAVPGDGMVTVFEFDLYDESSNASALEVMNTLRKS